MYRGLIRKVNLPEVVAEEEKKAVPCRGCLRESGCAPLSPATCLLARRFTQFTSLQISDSDGLPMFLCRECLSALNRAHQFKEQCLRSDTLFRSQIKENLNKPKPNRSEDLATDYFELNSLTDLIEGDNTLKTVKLENQDDDDDYYVLVINKEDEDVEMEKINPMPEVESDAIQTQLEDVVNNEEQFIMPDIDYQITESTQGLTNETINFENEKLKHEFSEIDYSLQVENTDDINNVRFDLIPLLKDNSEIVSSSIRKLEDCSSSLKPEFATEDTYTQEEVIVGSVEDTYENVDCNVTDLNINNLVKQDKPLTPVKDTSFVCKCGASFHDQISYDKHAIIHDKVTCTTCGKVFDSKAIKGHMLLHKSSDSHLPCPFCQKVIRRNLLTVHVTSVHGPNKPTCPICQKTFATEHNRKRHMMVHLDSDYKCDICHITFSHKMAMQNHRLIHEKLFELRCQECFEEFTTEAELEKHENGGCLPLAERKDSEMHICNKCGKIYYSLFSLQTHMEFVHGFEEDVLLCAECGEVFSNKKAMYAHSYTHCLNKKDKSRCKVCGKKCPNAGILKVHERVHTNERPFKCTKCPLTFKTKTHLTTHQLSHSQEKRFGCSVCMKFYSLKGNLIVHLRNHTGERPYVCNICSQAFIDSKYLKRHKLRRHMDSNW